MCVRATKSVWVFFICTAPYVLMDDLCGCTDKFNMFEYYKMFVPWWLVHFCTDSIPMMVGVGKMFNEPDHRTRRLFIAFAAVCSLCTGKQHHTGIAASLLPHVLSHWNDTVRRTQVDWKTLPLLLAQGRRQIWGESNTYLTIKFNSIEMWMKQCKQKNTEEKRDHFYHFL